MVTEHDKSILYRAANEDAKASRSTRVPPLYWRKSRWLRFLALACVACIVYSRWMSWTSTVPLTQPGVNSQGLSIKRLQRDALFCTTLRTKPVDPTNDRDRNARYSENQNPTLILNASVWTGDPANGKDPHPELRFSWIEADVYLQHGLIKHIGRNLSLQVDLPSDTIVYNAMGRPLTSGIIDMHSHASVHSLPTLHGNEDVSELSTNITPFVRSIDGIQPMDRQIQIIKSGGVTASLILPGSSDNIGGEAFVIKHAVGAADGRNHTSIRDMLAEPDRAWRYMKMACGENAKRVHGKDGYSGPTSRLGENWELRRAFEQAARLMLEQDNWCDDAALGLDRVGSYFPYELQWEALIQVLRGHVHVHTHCYTIPDFEAFVNLSNEFGFRVRAFHHAHQAHLVSEILKRAWGHDPPASALFADNMWYKAEAYIGSEYAGKHLYDNGLVPIYVSDNPVLNAQHVIFEAAKAYKYGLPYHASLAAVTTAPAERLGLGNRLGKVKQGFDADIVVWDSDPLSVGATPVQVWIDGTAQYDNPVELKKPFLGTITSNKYVSHVVENPSAWIGDIIVTGVSKVLLPMEPDGVATDGKTFNVVIAKSKIMCIGSCDGELAAASSASDVMVVKLNNGYLTPPFTAFGSTLGLNAIDSEPITDNGADRDTFSRAIDGLALDTKKLLISHRYGVTRAISAPKFTGGNTHHGTSVGFNIAGANSLDLDAVFADDVAVHYTLDLSAKNSATTTSISAAVGRFRDKLLNIVGTSTPKGNATGENSYSEVAFLHRVIAGELPIAITTHSADVIAAVLRAKTEIDRTIVELGGEPKVRLVFVGAAEAHLLADDLAAAGVGVLLAPLFSYGVSWDQRRALPGAPLTNATGIDVLMNAGVVTAIGLEEDWIVRDLGLLAGIVYTNGGGKISERDAVDLVSRRIYQILGLDEPDWRENFVLHEGSPLGIDSRVKAVSNGSGQLHLI